MKVTVICLDFDGVVADLDMSVWKNYLDIAGKPLPGVKEAIEKMRLFGALVLVHSTRCGYRGGVQAIQTWLDEHGIEVDAVCKNKPPADVYIDDKALLFDADGGAWNTLLPYVMREYVEKREDPK